MTHSWHVVPAGIPVICTSYATPQDSRTYLMVASMPFCVLVVLAVCQLAGGGAGGRWHRGRAVGQLKPAAAPPPR